MRDYITAGWRLQKLVGRECLLRKGPPLFFYSLNNFIYARRLEWIGQEDTQNSTGFTLTTCAPARRPRSALLLGAIHKNSCTRKKSIFPWWKSLVEFDWESSARACITPRESKRERAWNAVWLVNWIKFIFGNDFFYIWDANMIAWDLNGCKWIKVKHLSVKLE